MKTYDYINRVVLTLPLSVYEGTWTTLSPLVAMHRHDLATFPNTNIVIKYIDFYVSTISRLLAMSVIISGTPNNLRYIKTYKLII